MSPLHTANSTFILAPPDRIFRLAADIGEWPALLSHYRYVRFHDGLAPKDEARRRDVSMSASRSGIPVRWRSLQELRPERFEIVYHHIAGATRGMDVVWAIEPEGPGCRVSILHAIDVSRWWLRPAVVRWVVGRVFIQHVADRTLAGIKRLAEQRER